MTALLMAGLAYVIWRPVSNGAILYPTLGVMAVAAISTTIRDRLPANRTVLVSTWLLLTAVAIGLAVGGIWGNNPGLQQQATQWVGSIAIWALIANAMTVEVARKALKVTVLAVAFSAALMVLYIGAQRGLPVPTLPSAFVDEQGAGYSDTAGGGIRWYGLSTLAVGAPLVITSAIVGPDGILPRRKLTVPVAMLCVAAAAFSGRRAILIVTLATPILALAVRWWATRGRGAPIRIPPGVVYAAPVVFLAAVIGWGSEAGDRARAALADASATYLSGSSGASAATVDDLVRIQQGSELINGWSDSPILGHGLGAILNGFYRSEERPWNFELQYHMMLFDLGLVGAVLVTVAAVITARALHRAVGLHPEFTPSLVATTTGAVSLLIANASNPYLQAVGHGWGIALAAGVLAAVTRAPRPDGRSEWVFPVGAIRPDRFPESPVKHVGTSPRGDRARPAGCDDGTDRA